MNSTVALVGVSSHVQRLHSPEAALQSRGIRVTVCPADEPRKMLRWVMDLDPALCSLCVVADTDGRMTASLTTALDPAIAAVAWFPVAAEADKLVPAFADAATLISLAASPTILADALASLIKLPAMVAAAAPSPTATSAQPAAPPSATVTDVPVATVPPKDDLQEDLALYEQLETLMATPLKDRPKPEPVQVQRPGLDFSMPLRKLMSQGREAAHRAGHPEVLGAHYLTGLDEPYASAFARAGLAADQVAAYFAAHEHPPGAPTEPIISDEVFEAVAHAKSEARGKGASCIRVADFMQGLMSLENGSVAEVLRTAGVSLDDLRKKLAAFDSTPESCEGSFFAPSSMDQDSFYQFDAAQVRDVETRLRTLPGFKKAAERVAETQTASSFGARPKQAAPVVPIERALAPVPEKPEVFRISSDFPSVDVIEQMADRLLEGQVVAFPSDVMFALAVDATNPGAVDRLREAAGLHGDKRISIMIHSTSQLKHLVRADLDALENLFDDLWPGPLTLIFPAAPALGKKLAPDGTIGVRQPGDNTSLAILSMLGRPLATTSWDEPAAEGQGEADTAAAQLTGHAAMTLDNGLAAPRLRTTVVNITRAPWEVLREGAIPADAVLEYSPK